MKDGRLSEPLLERRALGPAVGLPAAHPCSRRTDGRYPAAIVNGVSERLLTISDRALAKVLGFRAGVDEPERQAMWMEVTGVHRGEFTYNLALKPRDAAAEGDAVEQHGDLAVVIAEGDVE